jgi:hypothetical protein
MSLDDTIRRFEKAVEREAKAGDKAIDEGKRELVAQRYARVFRYKEKLKQLREIKKDEEQLDD